MGPSSNETNDNIESTIMELMKNDDIQAAFDALPSDDCEWQSHILVGPCEGLKSYKDENVTLLACKQQCCDDEDCLQWQYHPIHGCLYGYSWYCQPAQPAPWNGQKMIKKEGDECEWETDELITQCFGLGNRRKGIDNKEDCAALCCELGKDDCSSWQFRDGGCFAGHHFYCSPDNMAYIGQGKEGRDLNLKSSE